MRRDRAHLPGKYMLAPDPAVAGLTRRVRGMTQTGGLSEVAVTEERPLTIFLNAAEIVTAMTIGDYPEYLALGFLANQGLIQELSEVRRVDFDAPTQTVVVRTDAETAHEEKLRKKIRTSGCAVGTVFGDLYDRVSELKLPPAQVRTSWLYSLASDINRTPSLYLEAGAIHGTVLCERDRPMVYMEDVGRHNAVDKVAGWMLSEGESGVGKILYTTGRLTSEMVIKTAMMGIPALASRSGFTAWGVELARRTGLTLIGRLRGRRFICLSGEDNLILDADISNMPGGETGHGNRQTMTDAATVPATPRTGRPAALGVILAGGLSRRMGGAEKSLLDLGGSPLISHVVGRLAPQTDHLIINANGDPQRFERFGLPVIPDLAAGNDGPLAGILAGLIWAREREFSEIITVAGDTPFFPRDLAERLREAADAARSPLALAATRHPDQGFIRHPTFGIFASRLAEDLGRELAAGTRKVVDWTDRHGSATAEFAAGPPDPFFNVNRPDDLAAASVMLKEFFQ